jgi:hypothetical protein
MRRAPRLFLLLALVGLGAAIWQRRAALTAGPSKSPEPSWPPFEPSTSDRPMSEPEPAAPRVAGATANAATWVAPVDGSCPEGYPIKANDNSGIFHVPGGRFYERTIPERCYANPEDALADGYRRAKA